MVNILQISDLHLLPEGQRAFGNIDTSKSLRQLTPFLSDIKTNIDAIIFTGDIFQDGASEVCCNYVKNTFIEFETLYLPGNHDSPLLINSLVNGQSILEGRFVFVRDWPECRAIGLDTTSGKHFGLLTQRHFD